MRKLMLAIVVAASLAVIGCGDSGGSSTPSPVGTSAAAATMRDLTTGEQVSLRCGLSLVVPSDYRGWYAQDPSARLGSYDAVGSKDVARKGLVASFMAQSETTETQSGPYQWPVIARSDDGAVEVRSLAVYAGTAKAVAYTSVVVRKPGQPIGLVMLTAYGEEAFADPDHVLAQVGSIWSRFSITGAALPPVED